MIIDESRKTLIFEILKGNNLLKLRYLYSDMKAMLNITGKKKNLFNSSELERRIDQLNKYQNDLKDLSEIILSLSSEIDSSMMIWYSLKLWAIEAHHKFSEERKKYNI